MSHSNQEYGADFSAQILREQLEVDRETFRQVLRSGEPPERPAPVEDPAVAELPSYAVEALSRCHDAMEISSWHLTADEAQQLAQIVWTYPRGQCERVRVAVSAALRDLRSDETPT